MNFFDAIRKGDLAEVNTLIANHPRLLTQKDPRGFTPLIMATYSNQPAVAKALLAAGAEVNEQDGAARNTALMGVCFKGPQEMVEMLLEHGADVNIQNAQGATALIYAAMFDQAAIAKTLLAAGADKTLRDASGLTALDHAKNKGLRDLVLLLESA